MKKSRFIIALSSLLIAALPNSLFAEEPTELLAYNASQKNSAGTVDDDILAAMQALDEVGAMLDTNSTSDKVDVDSILNAASNNNANKEAEQPNNSALAAAPAQSSKMTSFRIDDVLDAPKTQPANPEKSNDTALKPAKQDTVVAKAETKADAPKHNIQTAPAKPEKETKASAAKPQKPETVVAKAETQPVQKSVTTNGIHATTASQAGKPQPQLSPASAPQSLSMAYAMAIYKVNGVDLTQASSKKTMPSIAELYQYAFEKKLVYQSTSPAIGDLVFFHNTLDRNRDGRWNDWHTLVGVVESVDSDQTISILIYRTDHIERISMNLKYPELDKGKKGQILNTQLRPNEGAQKGTTAKLFAGFANLLGNATSVTVIDNWAPGMKIK